MGLLSIDGQETLPRRSLYVLHCNIEFPRLTLAPTSESTETRVLLAVRDFSLIMNANNSQVNGENLKKRCYERSSCTPVKCSKIDDDDEERERVVMKRERTCPVLRHRR